MIEPGKSEYRQLKMLYDHPDHTVRELAKALRVYTPGKDEVSPFRFNPFQYPKGVTTDEHIGQLLTCFEASMPLGGPLQALLAESVEAVYQYKMKQAVREKRDPDFPTMTELVDAARRIMEQKGYAGEVRSNLSAAIDVRLSGLTRLSVGRIFQCRQSLPSIESLLKHPTVIEIQNLNTYQACLLILFLLSAIWEEIRISRRYGKGLEHVTVIEEAHNIVGRTDQASPSEEFADPKAYAAEYVVRMLAEIRALGEGLIIADQLPSAVASSVVKNTGTKLAHRLVSLVDREDLGGAMLLQGPQMEEIARLAPGQAYYYTEGLYTPRQIAGLNARGFLGLGKSDPPDNGELSSMIRDQDWFLVLKRERYTYLVQRFSEQHKEVVDAVNKAAGHLELYSESFERINGMTEAIEMDRHAKLLLSDVVKSRNDLKASWDLFAVFVKSLPGDFTDNLPGSDLERYNLLVKSFKQKTIKDASVVEAALEDLRAQINDML